jgi:replication factor C subunit 3/5
MLLWVDQHRPKTLDELNHHTQLSSQPKRLISCGDSPHMLFYGPSGAGKKIRIKALLRELYGPWSEKLRVEERLIKVDLSKIVCFV